MEFCPFLPFYDEICLCFKVDQVLAQIQCLETFFSVILFPVNSFYFQIDVRIRKPLLTEIEMKDCIKNPKSPQFI